MCTRTIFYLPLTTLPAFELTVMVNWAIHMLNNWWHTYVTVIEWKQWAWRGESSQIAYLRVGFHSGERSTVNSTAYIQGGKGSAVNEHDMTLFLQYHFLALQRFANKLNGCASAHVVRSLSCHQLIALLIWTVRVKPLVVLLAQT